MSFVGKSALITGGVNGIGLATAKELIKQGVKGVVLLDINSSAGEEAVKAISKEHPNVNISFIKTDVGQDDQVKDAYKQAKSKLGYIDIVVNSAGVYDDKRWPVEVSVNVIGMISSNLQAIEAMRTDKGGKGGVIINVSSMAGLSSNAICPIYSCTKAAAVSMSRCFGDQLYFTKTGVKVAVVCPGLAVTNMYQHQFLNNVLDEAIVSLDVVRKMPASMDIQSSEDVGKGILKVIQDGAAGSVWIINEKRTYEVELSYKEK